MLVLTWQFETALGAKKDNLDAHFPFFADGVTFKVSGWDSLHNWSTSASIQTDWYQRFFHILFQNCNVSVSVVSGDCGK